MGNSARENQKEMIVLRRALGGIPVEGGTNNKTGALELQTHKPKKGAGSINFPGS